MKPNVHKFVVALLVVLMISLPTSACQWSISRNADNSLSVETSVSQEALQAAIEAAIADPLIKSLTVSLQPGYALVSGERQRLNDPSWTDRLTFRLDLGVNNGRLTAAVSNALLDSIPIEQNRVDHWNETIAARLQKIGQKNPNTSLQSVSITPAGVSMIWLIEKK